MQIRNLRCKFVILDANHRFSTDFQGFSLIFMKNIEKFAPTKIFKTTSKTHQTTTKTIKRIQIPKTRLTVFFTIPVDLLENNIFSSFFIKLQPNS